MYIQQGAIVTRRVMREDTFSVDRGDAFGTSEEQRGRTYLSTVELIHGPFKVNIDGDCEENLEKKRSELMYQHSDVSPQSLNGSETERVVKLQLDVVGPERKVILLSAFVYNTLGDVRAFLEKSMRHRVRISKYGLTLTEDMDKETISNLFQMDEYFSLRVEAEYSTQVAESLSSQETRANISHSPSNNKPYHV